MDIMGAMKTRTSTSSVMVNWEALAVSLGKDIIPPNRCECGLVNMSNCDQGVPIDDSQNML